MRDYKKERKNLLFGEILPTSKLNGKLPVQGKLEAG